jgi:putative transposase
LVVDPHSDQALGVEDDDGQSLGAVTPLDALANVNRRRRQPQPPRELSPKDTDNAVELAYREYYGHSREDS